MPVFASPAHIHPPTLPREATVRRAFALVIGVAAAYALAYGAGVLLNGGTPSVFWPPAGVALAAVIRFGWPALPGLAVGALAVTPAAGYPLPVAVVVVAGCLAGAGLGGWLARRRGRRLTLDRVSDVGMLAVAAVVGAVPSAVIGALTLWSGGLLPAGPAAGMLVWWVGDVAGVLLVAPILLYPARSAPSPYHPVVVWAGLAVSAAAALWFAANHGPPGLPRVPALAACLPVLVIAAVRYGPRGAALANVIPAAVVLVLGFHAPTIDRLALIAFLAVSAVTTLSLGAVTAERDAAHTRLASDIAARAEAEAARATDRARFSALLEHSHDVIAVMTPDGRTAFVSDAIVRLTGRTPAELIGRATFEHVHPDDDAIVRMAFADALAQPGVPAKAEFRARTADGRWIWVEAVGTSYLDNPAVGGVVVNIRDVTERREVERRLREAQSLLETSGRLARIGGWEYIIPADRLTWSEQTYHIHEVSPGEYTPTVAAAIDFYTPEARPVIHAAIERGMGNGEGWDLVLALNTARGRRLWVNAIGQVEMRDGKPYRLFGTFQDVTERVEAEQAVERLQDRFRQAAKLEAVGRLAGGVAHDFNNLLTVINGFSELLAAEAEPGSASAELVAHIRNAGGRAAELTRQLLAFSRKQPPTAGPVDLSTVVACLRPLLEPLVGEGVGLVTRLAAVPVIVADRGQIESVVMNLCVNARDAMPDGGTLTVETGVLDTTLPDAPDDPPPGKWVVLSVADTGTGIPDEARPHLFEPFFTTKELGKGTGLGLPTVYGIVTTAGGHVRYDTAIGRGTTFRIYLPASNDEGADAGEYDEYSPVWAGVRGTPSPSGSSPRPSRAGPRAPVVLLVEDQTAVRELSARVLEDAGFKVVVAIDGADALGRLAALPAPPGILVTDVMMPGINGRELADRVRAVHPAVRVLFVSGYAPTDVLTGSEAFLEKPFTVEELAAAVRALTGPRPSTHPDG